MNYFDIFSTTGTAIAKLLILSLAGYVLLRMNIVTDKGFHSLSRLVVTLTLPCLIFSNILNNFDPTALPGWWLFPLIGSAVGIALLLAGYGISRLLKVDIQDRRCLMCMLAFQNAGYIPLPLAAALLPTGEREVVFTYIFLLIMGHSPTMWSIGAGLLSGHLRRGNIKVHNIITPPFAATILSVAFVLLGLDHFVPSLLMDTISTAGDVTIPLIMIALGGILGGLKPQGRSDYKALAILILIKLMVLPAVALLIINIFNPTSLFGFFLIIQAASPPATALAVMGNHYGIETDFLNRGILYSYLCAIITIPIIISIYSNLQAAGS